MAKMTEAQTQTDICNLALAQDGADLILTIADTETSDNAQLCRQLLPVAISICLVRHEWNFAGKFADLGNEAEVNEQADWEYVFNLPEDCLHVIAQISEGNSRKKFRHKVIGQKLYTNHLSNDDGDSAYIDYVSISSVARYSPGFIEYVALKLAIMMAPKFMGTSSEGSALHIQNMQRELRLRVLPEAIGRNQAEGDVDGGNDEGEATWLRDRGGSPSGCDCCGRFPCECS